jgi:hypothetical protein
VEAITFSEKSIRLVPHGRLRAYGLKANVYKRTKYFKRAPEAVAMVVALKPDGPSIRMILARGLETDAPARAGGRRRSEGCPIRRLADQISTETIK